MGGVELTGEDFYLALQRAGIHISLDEADNWFDAFQEQSLIDIEKIHGSVTQANDVDEELTLLGIALDEEIKEKGLAEVISSDLQRRQLERDTGPAPNYNARAIRL